MALRTRALAHEGAAVLGRAADFEVCLALSTQDQVPVFRGGAIVPGPPVMAAEAEGRR